MPSAICASTASIVRCSTSPWCDSMQCTTSGDSFSRRAISAPMIACDPSTSWVTALPMSCRNAPRLAIVGSTPELGGERGGDVRRLDEVLQDVLSVGRPVLQPPEELDHLRVDVGDPHLGHRVLARAPDLLLDARAASARAISSIRAGWIRPSATSFSSVMRAASRRTGSKQRQHHGLGRVVDDEVHAGRGLERADVPALTADDPALHVLARQGEHRDRRLGGLLGGDALDRDRDDLARPLLAFLAGRAARSRGPGSSPRACASSTTCAIRCFASLRGRHAARPARAAARCWSAAFSSCSRTALQLLVALVELGRAAIVDASSRLPRRRSASASGEPASPGARSPRDGSRTSSSARGAARRSRPSPPRAPGSRGRVGLALGLQEHLLGLRLDALRRCDAAIALRMRNPRRRRARGRDADQHRDHGSS